MKSKRNLSIILISILSVILAVFLCCCGIDTSNVAGSASGIYTTDETIEENDSYEEDGDTQNEISDNIADQEEDSQLEEAEVTDEEMVWISRTGKCYHSKSTCSNMKNPSQIPLSQAQRTRKACKKCY